jgi:hypothetical protein
MRRTIFIAEMVLCIMSLSCILVTSEVMAYGLGVYGSYGYGWADWKSDSSTSGRLEKDAGHYGIGILFDTAVAKDELFNYRLNLGYEKLKARPGEGTLSYDLDGVIIDNDFGFGLIRTKSVRVWVGPELRLQYWRGYTTGSNYHDTNIFGVGIGPVIGLNYHFGPLVSLGLKGGYLYNYFGGTGPDTDFYVKENLIFINAAIIFRFGE